MPCERIELAYVSVNKLPSLYRFKFVTCPPKGTFRNQESFYIYLISSWHPVLGYTASNDLLPPARFCAVLRQSVSLGIPVNCSSLIRLRDIATTPSATVGHFCGSDTNATTETLRNIEAAVQLDRSDRPVVAPPQSSIYPPGPP